MGVVAQRERTDQKRTDRARIEQGLIRQSQTRQLPIGQDQIQALFGALAGNRVDQFLDGCSENVLITVWGACPLSSTVPPRQFPLWWDGFRQLTGGTLVTEVLLTLVDEVSQVVILRHEFTREGRRRRFDTVNFCTLRDGALVAWFSRPLDRQEYVEAWGLRSPDDHDRPTTSKYRSATSDVSGQVEHR